MSPTKLRVIPYEGWHYRRLWRSTYGTDAGFAAAWQHRLYGPAWTAVLPPDDAIVACAGVHINHPGLGRAWALLGPLAARHILGVTRAARTGLATIIADHGLRRVEALVYEGDVRNLRWAGLFGFHVEHRMKEYGPEGQTAMLLVRFKERA